MIVACLFALALLASNINGLAPPSIPFTGFESTSQSFIVKLKPGHSCQSHFSRIKGSLSKVEISRATHFDSRVFNGYAIKLDDQATVKSLSLLDSVEYIEPDTVFSVASKTTQTDAAWGLQAITRSYDSSAGQGVDIYLLDSGVYSNHTDFANHTDFTSRVEHSPVFARYTTTGDVFGHGRFCRTPAPFKRADHTPTHKGTHVAGIAAGTRFGVAKQARIIDVKVITDTGRGFASDIIAGLGWAVAHANSTGRPSVFNLSLGGGTSNALDDAVMGVVNAGYHTVVAGGNAGVDIDTTEWSPARVPGVVAVGCIDYTGIRIMSNYGSQMALFAPGVNITSAGINGPNSSRVDSGTSMAAPHVAGLIAYLTGLEGPRTPPEMKTRVQALARADILSGIRKNRILISFEQIIDYTSTHVSKWDNEFDVSKYTATLPILHSRPTDQQTDALSKPHRKGSQLPTPNSSPPGTPPTLLEQTSSSYVLELSLAILASIYFQPGYQQASPNLPSSRCDADSATRAASPSLPALSTPRLELSTLLPVTPTSVSRTVPSQKPQKYITPLTPQSPCPILKPAALPPLPPTFQLEPPIHVQSLPSKRELTRHLSALGALEPQPGAAPAGSMRWFLTELFKRAALPGLIIRVAAGYVLRCRAAINCAMQTVALKNQLATSDVSLPPADRTPQERVLTDARRVFLAALVLACKFVFDKPYDNRSWSLISGLGSRDIGECERVVGDVLGWRLWIGAGRSLEEQ
ncbi:unnamed protein product [Rhizoctonia solani]|uniref:Peptidase S8/S53 domain-containing protein n=1 Tax=Rhizoctonia solani TaxID=456999 RepID=A0A8H2Y0B6_9AGAM|nr:unnamed protein product [Rhizoctonia solani]